MRTVVFVHLLLACLTGSAAGAASLSADSVYRGWEDEIRVRATGLAAEIEVDGRLDEAVWEQSVVLTGFSQYSPVDGVPAADSTEVLVWHSAEAIHFGIRAFETHGEVNAQLADRDRIDGEDHVQILLDTFNDGRRAYVFGVNALGIQSDGMRIEGTAGGGGFLSAASEDPVDLSPDYQYDSNGRLTPFGFEVEVRIPFSSIKYQDADEQAWGLNVIRRVQHSGREQTWTRVRRDRASFLGQSGTLTGLVGLDRGLVLDVNPVLTTRMNGAPTPSGWDYGEPSPEFGTNLRWGVTSNLVLSGTYNPDFSQVETDVGQLGYDPRIALFFPEKRPFFMEGSEQFEVPNRLIYTRRIVSPDGAIKLTGNISDFNVGMLSAVDDATLSGSDSDHPVVNMLRLQRDVGAASTLGFVYTDWVESAEFNRVVGADTRLVFGDIYTLSLQGAASFTRTGAETVGAPLWEMTFDRRGRRFTLEGGVKGIDDEFVTRAGFLQRTGVAQARISPKLNFYGDPGALIESWDLGLRFIGDWRYDTFVDAEGPDDTWKIHLTSNFSVVGGWRFGASILWEKFFYAHELYEDYSIERTTSAGTDTIPFVGQAELPNYDIVLQATTPSFSQFNGHISVIAGQDDNFDEWANAYILFVNATLGWRPTEQIRVDASYALRHYARIDSWETQASRKLPRVKLEYQLTRSIFVRFVGEYSAEYRDALIDDTRTGDPILVRDPESGEYERTQDVTSNDFRADWLFSYRPNPGTVIFAGYGSSMTEPDSFRFRGLRRTQDGFFLKLSYLFRL